MKEKTKKTTGRPQYAGSMRENEHKEYPQYRQNSRCTIVYLQTVAPSVPTLPSHGNSVPEKNHQLGTGRPAAGRRSDSELFPRRIGRPKSSPNKRTDLRNAASVPEPSTTAKITEKDYRDRRMNADRRPRWGAGLSCQTSCRIPIITIRRLPAIPLTSALSARSHRVPCPALLYMFPPPGPGFDSHLRTPSELPSSDITIIWAYECEGSRDL